METGAWATKSCGLILILMKISTQEIVLQELSPRMSHLQKQVIFICSIVRDYNFYIFSAIDEGIDIENCASGTSTNSDTSSISSEAAANDRNARELKSHVCTYAIFSMYKFWCTNHLIFEALVTMVNTLSS